MTKTLTTLLVLTALIIHAVFGCCAHHTHGTDGVGGGCIHDDSGHEHAHATETVACSTSPVSGPSCGTFHQDGDQSDEPADHHPHLCDEVSCQWIDSSASAWSLIIDYWGLQPVDIGGAIAAMTEASRPSAACGTPLGRLSCARACALTQVWLL